MQESDLHKLIDNLLLESEERTWLEFKTNIAASNASITPEGVGEYISALSNGATISNKDFGYLLLGIKDGNKHVVGTNLQISTYKVGNQDFELWLRNFIYPKINFEVFETNYHSQHIVLFRIPAAKGEPTNFQKKPYIRINSQKTDLRNHPAYIRQIYNSLEDWSAKIIESASVDDLDPQALEMARAKFKEKNSNESFYPEIDQWEMATFLDKAKITINKKITNTAILLLGNPEAAHYLLPAICEITWKLDTVEKAYEHFSCPLLLNTTKVLQRIRNYQYKFFPNNELLATTVSKYEPRVILEALHNAIAHQDYLKNARVIVTEKAEKIIFKNAGGFYLGAPEEYYLGDKTPDRYRNSFLVKAMVNLGMIDTMGYGIYTMLLEQRKRYFPLPDYEETTPDSVVLAIYGQEIDVNYSKLLIENKALPLSTVVLLDKIQKKKAINREAAEMLRKEKLIEGRSPNFHVSATVAKVTNRQADYIKNKGFDDEYYRNLIREYIKKFGQANRKQIEELLMDKLPDILNQQQKSNKVKNLLSWLKNNGEIERLGIGQKKSIWQANKN
ncbi:RNA-binding domain-containing protein [Runella sp.]|uniref:RNA-binding domain-containing protein n=1 Tax=Runella sp. TaxID=1960881 RepID=UPI003D1051FA